MLVVKSKSRGIPNGHSTADPVTDGRTRRIVTSRTGKIKDIYRSPYGVPAWSFPLWDTAVPNSGKPTYMTNDLTAHFIHAQNSTLTCFSILSDHGLNAKQLRMILLEHLKRHLFRQSTTASF